MQQQLKTLGGIYIALGELNLLIAAAYFVAIGIDGQMSEGVLVAVTTDIRGVIASVSLLAAIVTFIGGIGLLKRKSWSWSVVWVLAPPRSLQKSFRVNSELPNDTGFSLA